MAGQSGRGDSRQHPRRTTTEGHDRVLEPPAEVVHLAAAEEAATWNVPRQADHEGAQPMSGTTSVPEDTTTEQLRAHAEAAAKAAPALDETGPTERARMLEAIADALDADSDRLVQIADAETHLGSPRLPGELARTTGQLRMFAARDLGVG